MFMQIYGKLQQKKWAQIEAGGYSTRILNKNDIGYPLFVTLSAWCINYV